MQQRIGVLFVCLGNICRSPMAEAIFRHLASQRGVSERFDVDSCGTGDWHAGGPADPRTIATLRARGVPIDHVARPIDVAADLRRFGHVLAMDAMNLRHLTRMGIEPGRVRLVRAYDAAHAGRAGDAPEVPDPYQGDEQDFDRCFDMLHAACAGLLDALLAEAAAGARQPGGRA